MPVNKKMAAAGTSRRTVEDIVAGKPALQIRRRFLKYASIRNVTRAIKPHAKR